MELKRIEKTKTLLNKVAFVLVLTLLISSIVIADNRFHFKKTRTVTSDCYAVVLSALRTGKASGMWNCLSPELQAAEFQNLGWNGDAQVQIWLDHFYGKTVNIRAFLRIEKYSGNPIQRCLVTPTLQCQVDPTGHPAMRTAYLIFIIPTIEDDPYVDVIFNQDHNLTSTGAIYTTNDQSNTSLIILLNPDGLIAQLQ
jgi:hypothetical protein